MDSEVRDLRLSTGITVPCLVQGDADAKPVLLLHAWAESRGSFDRLIPMLTGFRVYAPDLRGQGEAAVTYPERIAALVLVGSPQSLQGRPAFADEVDVLTDPLDAAWVRESLTWFPMLHEVPAWFIEDRVRDGLRMPAHVWKGILNGLCEATPPTESGAIHAPTLILWGAQDNLLPRGDQETLAARIPGAVLKVYPGVAHVVLWECPARVAEDMTAFFRSVGDAREPADAL